MCPNAPDGWDGTQPICSFYPKPCGLPRALSVRTNMAPGFVALGKYGMINPTTHGGEARRPPRYSTAAHIYSLSSIFQQFSAALWGQSRPIVCDYAFSDAPYVKKITRYICLASTASKSFGFPCQFVQLEFESEEPVEDAAPQPSASK